MAGSKLLAQSFWLVCHLQVIGTLLQEAEHVKQHSPLTLDGTATSPWRAPAVGKRLLEGHACPGGRTHRLQWQPQPDQVQRVHL